MATQYIGRDSQGRLIGPGFASLTYKAGSTTRIYQFWLEEIEQRHSLSGTSAQSQFFQHFYAKSYAPDPLQVTGRVRDQKQYDALAEYVRDHQILLVSTRGSNNPDVSAQKFQLPLMTLRIASEGLVYGGWIDSFEGGAKRFNVAPQFTFSFTTIEDRHSTNSKLVPSHALQSVFSGAFLTGPVSQKQATKQVEQQSSADALSAQIALANRIKTQNEPGGD